MKQLTGILLALSVALAPCAFAGQQGELSEESLLFMDIPSVIAVSKKMEKVTDAPATVCVITKKDILLRGYVTLIDVLRDLPGMETIENYQSEMGTEVPVRGVLGNNKIILLINGMRVNPPGGEELMLRRDVGVRFAERIEVIYGPGSTMYGQDAISCVINIVTKAPKYENLAEGAVACGTNDYKDGYLGFVRNVENVNLSGMVQYIDAGLSDLSSTYSRYWDATYKPFFDANPGIDPAVKRWDRGLNIFLRAGSDQNSIQVWHRDSSRSSSEGGYAGILYYVDQAVWHDYSTVVESKNTMRFSKDFELESSLTFNRYEIDPATRYVWSPGAGLNYDDYKYGLGTGVSLEEKALMNLDERLSLVSGIALSTYDIIPKATIPGSADRSRDITSQGGMFTYYTEQGNANSRVDIARVNDLVYQTCAAYLEANYRFTDRLTGIAGGRVDRNSRYTDSTPFSPRLAAIYKFNDHYNVKYIYTQAFISPSPYATYTVYDNGSTFMLPATDIKPETATSNELTVGYNRENVMLSASLYYNQQDNLIVYDDAAPAAGTVWMDAAGTQPRTLRRATNLGESRSVGADLSGRYSMDRISLWGSYSYVDARTERQGERTGLPGISRNNVRFGTTYSLLDNLWLTGSVVYRSMPENINEPNELEMENPYEINAYALYKAASWVDLFLDLRNVTDNRYALRGVSTPTPQEPFRAYFGVRLYR